MYGSIVTEQLKQIIQSLSTGRRVLFDPRALLKETVTTPQAKAKQVQNIRRLLTSGKYRTLVAQLEKEIDINLIK